jgi:hypothetical protein
VPTTVGVAPSTVSSTFGNATGAIFNRVSFVQNDAWTEGALNWNNKPTADPFFRELIAYPNEPVFFDVTSLVRTAQGGDKKLSLLLNTYVDNASSQSTYATSENGTVAFRPQLVIETLDGVFPVADATVRGGVNANTTHGTLPTLEIRTTPPRASTTTAKRFLRFDLNGLSGPPTNAFLRLMPLVTPTPVQHSVQTVSDDTWVESTVTWNTKPAAGATQGSWTPVIGRYANVNVTPIAASEYGTANKLLSLKVISDTASSAAQVQYASRENGTEMFRPMLISSNTAPSDHDDPERYDKPEHGRERQVVWRV